MNTSTCLEDEEFELACVDECESAVIEFEETGDDCLAAFADYASCVGELSCEQFFDDEPPAECNAALAAFESKCEGGEGDQACESWGGGSADGEHCEAGTRCDGEVRRVVCDGSGCVCHRDDAVVARCEAAGACGAEEAYSSCCGWER